MRLSDAIGMGRTLVKELTPGRLSGCAQGMALLACGGAVDIPHFATTSGMPIFWPWIRNPLMLSPCGCDLEHSLDFAATFQGAIAHVFDRHVFGFKNWTLDQLIDWVRSVEPEERIESTLAGEVACEVRGSTVTCSQAKHA